MVIGEPAQHHCIDTVGGKIEGDSPEPAQKPDDCAENQITPLGVIGKLNQDLRYVFTSVQELNLLFYKGKTDQVQAKLVNCDRCVKKRLYCD